jgi:hypothetical protein
VNGLPDTDREVQEEWHGAAGRWGSSFPRASNSLWLSDLLLLSYELQEPFNFLCCLSQHGQGFCHILCTCPQRSLIKNTGMVRNACEQNKHWASGKCKWNPKVYHNIYTLMAENS